MSIYMASHYEQLESLVGSRAELGDIVASGIEPGEAVGRIVAFYIPADRYREGDHSVVRVVVQHFDGELRTGHFHGAYVGFCRRAVWPGPTPNALAEHLWAVPHGAE